MGAHAFVCAHVHRHVHTCIHIYAQACAYMYVCMCAHALVYMCVCVHVCMHMCVCGGGVGVRTCMCVFWWGGGWRGVGGREGRYMFPSLKYNCKLAIKFTYKLFSY